MCLCDVGKLDGLELLCKMWKVDWSFKVIWSNFYLVQGGLKSFCGQNVVDVDGAVAVRWRTAFKTG